MIYINQILPGKLPFCISWDGLEDAITELGKELRKETRDVDCWTMSLWQSYCQNNGIEDDTMDETIETNDEYVIIRKDPRFIAPIYHSAPNNYDANVMVYNLWVEFKANEGTTCISFYSDEDAQDGLNSGWRDAKEEDMKVLEAELTTNKSMELIDNMRKLNE